jgi:integrase
VLFRSPAEIDKTGSEHDVPVSRRLLGLFLSMGLGTRRADAGDIVFPAQRRRSGVRGNIETAFRSALGRCGLDGRGISPYALRRTRITIWDAVDSNACRYAVGHVSREVHLRHYVRISHERLFRLVGLDFRPPFQPPLGPPEAPAPRGPCVTPA